MYDPEEWLLSTIRTIKQYVIDGLAAPNVYDVVMEFPGAALDLQKVPLTKTLIHFEIDDIPSSPLGFGDSPARDNYDSMNQQNQPQWAEIVEINFDVGVWASAKSGGITQRARARQSLGYLFGYPQGVENLRAYSDNGDGVIEIIRPLEGGHFAIDRINDVPVYRMVNCSLDVRVFSRTPLVQAPVVPTIEEIDQNPNLTIIG